MPPVAVAVAEPLLPPSQETSEALVVRLKALGWLIITEPLTVHPFLSVTVIVYVPPDRLFAVAPVAPLLHR